MTLFSVSSRFLLNPYIFFFVWYFVSLMIEVSLMIILIRHVRIIVFVIED